MVDTLPSTGSGPGPSSRRQGPDVASRRVLGGLVLDTVELLGRAPFDAGAAWSLRSLWRRAYELGESLRDERVTDESPECEARELLGPALGVVPQSNGGPFPVMLVAPHWRLQAHPERGTAKLILNASFLAEARRADVVREVERVACFLWRGAGSFTVSRLDVAADCVGLDVADFARLDECVMQATRATMHMDGEAHELDATRAADVARIVQSRARVETVTLGVASSSVQLCLYDKLAELRASGKKWQEASLRARGWDGQASVTRIEARFRSRALDEFASDGFELRPVASLVDFDTWGPELWSYATRKSVRFVVPSESDTNRARWRTRADWAWLQAQSQTNEEPVTRSRVITPAQREERARRASRAIIRGLVTLAAEHPDVVHRAPAMMRAALDAGQAPEIALAASVFASVGDLVGLRAMGVRDPESRALTLRAALDKRAAWVEWANDYEAPLLGRPRYRPGAAMAA